MSLTNDPDCPVCQFVASVQPAATVYSDEHWLAGIFGGGEVPGWLAFALRRHALGPTAMTAPEAAALGPALLELTSAMETALDSERIYVQAWGEKAEHFHFLVASRGAEIPREHRHTKFWDHREAYINPPAAEVAAALIREQLTASRSKVETTQA